MKRGWCEGWTPEGCITEFLFALRKWVLVSLGYCRIDC